jgi:hypothetical protein
VDRGGTARLDLVANATVRQTNSRPKYPTFRNQFFAQPCISEIVWGIRKKMFKKLYEQYFMTQHGPEPALVEN